MFVVCCESLWEITVKYIQVNLSLSSEVHWLDAQTHHPAIQFLWRVFSPHSHLTVHHTWEVKLGQQILHLVVFLAVLLHVSMVTRDVRAQHVPHQEGQTALLTITVFLKDITNKLLSVYTCGYADSICIRATFVSKDKEGVLLLIYGRWLPPWSSL